jgi:hypothetical protein
MVHASLAAHHHPAQELAATHAKSFELLIAKSPRGGRVDRGGIRLADEEHWRSMRRAICGRHQPR